MLEDNSNLFDETLGKWNMGEYDIELRSEATSYHAWAYPIPKAYTDTIKLKVERLEIAGKLKRVNRSKWATLTFIIPTKDGSVRFILDFRELNKQIKRKLFLIPKILVMLRKLEGLIWGITILNKGLIWKDCAPSSYHGVNTSTNGYPWDYAIVQTPFRRKCLTYRKISNMYKPT